ncbi:secretory protein SSP120 [Geosmithia morbida]|uniref:Secretory protein SSP120 n=1 Tax=Geosmithia morbida TaxID=1094350 RepID=A0A9P5D6N0_9HYPO|nr:secretory protein SSP120 [Geosmithia morbida]KAF4123679.1 secretory protein SSP120 [Geosmithia morbida]
MHLQSLLPVAVALVSLASAHGDHAPEADENANWMTKHMAEEHHMQSFDDAAFFALHDYNSDGQWQVAELLRTYGLMDESNEHVGGARRAELADRLLTLLDTDGDRAVSRDEWLSFTAAGNDLPDLGTGPGHHGDDEYEYEIHHWEKFHGDDTKLEDLTHPEDIEHFRKHEQMEDDQDKLEEQEKQPIIEANIPLKFRKQQ